MATPQEGPGKPLRFQTVAELQTAIDEYFDYCDNRIQKIFSPKTESVIEVIDPAPYTMSGLARTIGLSRQALSEYSHKEEYGDTIKAAREKVHEDVETRLMEKNSTGAIFNLKNNFGWKDKTEQDITSAGKPIPLLAGIAPNELEVDDAPAQADDSTDQDQPAS